MRPDFRSLCSKIGFCSVSEALVNQAFQTTPQKERESDRPMSDEKVFERSNLPLKKVNKSFLYHPYKLNDGMRPEHFFLNVQISYRCCLSQKI